MNLDQAITNTRAHLLSLRNERGHWEGELSSSALSTATAMGALSLVDAEKHRGRIATGTQWLVENQNADGGWGDTTISQSNLSTTLLCWSALHLVSSGGDRYRSDGKFTDAADRVPAVSLHHAATWIAARVGSLEPEKIVNAVVARYGKDKTFSVPILMHCAICGTLGDDADAWRRVLALPFELAALPRAWFGAVGLPVVSYALPALIAIGHARFHHAPPPKWSPLFWLRRFLWEHISPMLHQLQPSSGGYLEATPLTSFVTMALACAGEKFHPCVPVAVEFLERSQREDGSWAIDTNLATWGTTLAVKALGDERSPVMQWLLGQQYQTVHPFTNAAPGGWAWTDLPGGVPDADDTAGALIALRTLDGRRLAGIPYTRAITWLLDLQNRDGGIPTFCRGWGTLPFDRSAPELTAHALLAWWLWHDEMPRDLQQRIRYATDHALIYLAKTQRADGSWVPLWFGNEHAKGEENPVYGTAQVLAYLAGCGAIAEKAKPLIQAGARYLLAAQKADGSWGGDATAPSSIEETGVALHALIQSGASFQFAPPLRWLLTATKEGTHFPTAPIGLYFARLWYHERLYPVVWTLQALASAQRVAEPRERSVSEDAHLPQ